MIIALERKGTGAYIALSFSNSLVGFIWLNMSIGSNLPDREF